MVFNQKYPPIQTRHPRARPERNEAIVRALLIDELTMAQVAEMYSISKQRVQQIADRAGIRQRHSKGQSKARILQEQAAFRREARLEHYEEALDLIRDGMSVSQAAAHAKIPYVTLMYRVRLDGFLLKNLNRSSRFFPTKAQRKMAEEKIIEGWGDNVIAWETGIGWPSIVRMRKKLQKEGKLSAKPEGEKYGPMTEIQMAAHEYGLILDGEIDEFMRIYDLRHKQT